MASRPSKPAVSDSYTGLVVRLQLPVRGLVLSFFSASTIFGTPVDITLAELAIESFFAVDDNAAFAMRELVPGISYLASRPN